MKIRSVGMILGVITYGAVLIIGCGSSSSDDSGGTGAGQGAGTGGSSSMSQNFTCCINGTNYTCPSSAAVSACGTGDTSQCTETGMSTDGKCH